MVGCIRYPGGGGGHRFCNKPISVHDDSFKGIGSDRPEAAQFGWLEGMRSNEVVRRCSYDRHGTSASGGHPYSHSQTRE